jgi:hypothetical protein
VSAFGQPVKVDAGKKFKLRYERPPVACKDALAEHELAVTAYDHRVGPCSLDDTDNLEDGRQSNQKRVPAKCRRRFHSRSSVQSVGQSMKVKDKEVGTS